MTMDDKQPKETLRPARKLTEINAAAIFHHTGTISGIAREFGVSRRLVRLIKDGVKWPGVARAAAMTRDATETIRARAERDPDFRAALVAEAAECDRGGDAETAQALRDHLPQQFPGPLTNHERSKP